jgi:hypothetical protein
MTKKGRWEKLDVMIMFHELVGTDGPVIWKQHCPQDLTGFNTNAPTLKCLLLAVLEYILTAVHPDEFQSLCWQKLFHKSYSSVTRARYNEELTCQLKNVEEKL